MQQLDQKIVLIWCHSLQRLGQIGGIDYQHILISASWRAIDPKRHWEERLAEDNSSPDILQIKQRRRYRIIPTSGLKHGFLIRISKNPFKIKIDIFMTMIKLSL